MKTLEKGYGAASTLLALALIMVALGFSMCGCASMVPSWIKHPFGTPITKEAKIETKAVVANTAVLNGVQTDLHKIDDLIEFAAQGNKLALPEVKLLAKEATSLIDQTQGAPTAASSANWQAEVDGLVSENKALHESAVAQQARDSATIASQSTTLGKLTAEKTAIETKVTQYAKDNEGLADDVRLFKWIVIGIVVLWCLAQLLKIFAFLNPGVAAASAVVNGVLAPATSAAEASAKAGLTAVGNAVGTLRVQMPAAAAQIITTLDANLDTAHQTIIGKAANTTVGVLTGAPAVPKTT